MPKYRHGSGSVYLRGKTYWIAYYAPDGKQVCESTGQRDRAEARRRLNEKLGAVATGKYTGPAAERVTVRELAEGVVADYRLNGKRSLRELSIRVHKHLLPFLGEKKAHALTTADIREFITQRQGEGASNGSINRDLAALKRAFNLGIQGVKITRKPYIPMLKESNVRQGFFEAGEWEALLAQLPDYLRPPLTFAYYTGWRVQSEILPLTWSRVDLEAGTVRLHRGETKSGEGRVIVLPFVLRQVLEEKWQEHLARFPECPYVFHCKGRKIKDIRGAWERACKDAGLQGRRLPHDFRRTAVRNLVRAGVPERVAMTISGHKTRDVFERYNVVSPGDLEEAAKRIDERIAARTTTISTTIAGEGQDSQPLSH
jgi:integrase